VQEKTVKHKQKDGKHRKHKTFNTEKLLNIHRKVENVENTKH
jgi:hypothetical protein